MEMCHPSPLLGFYSPLLIVLGTSAGSFGGDAKSSDCRAQIIDQADNCVQNSKSPCVSLAYHSVVRPGSKPLFSPCLFRFSISRNFFLMSDLFIL